VWAASCWRRTPTATSSTTSATTPTGRRLDTGGSISGEVDFTGQHKDATDLLYYNARYYDPQLGQFLSPDTIVPDPTQLIDYNRYLYARGNPLKYNDPSGHIPEREACSYLQACSEDEFVDKYGQELTDLLWGTDVSWGDKLSWDNKNVGMLVLLEAGNGKHTGVLWGITGRGVGQPIYLDMLHKEGITQFDITEATDVDTVWDLPLDPGFKYGGYYSTEYVDVSELWWLTTVGGITGIGEKVGRLAGGISIGSQTIKAADTIDDLKVAQSLEANETLGNLAQGASYWWSKTFGQAWTSYPTIRFSPSGSLGFTLHMKGPGGAR
jgi:RHS repeat-associated protein